MYEFKNGTVSTLIYYNRKRSKNKLHFKIKIPKIAELYNERTNYRVQLYNWVVAQESLKVGNQVSFTLNSF